jgi:hypothetical protein
LRDISDGIAASERSVEALGTPLDREEEQFLSLVECTHVQLLVHAGRLSHAQASAQSAMLMAARSESARARIESSLVYGLVQVATGYVPSGLSRIKAAQREAGHDLVANRLSCLRVLVQAFELLGRPDEALSAYRAWVKLIKHLRVASLHGAPHLPDSQRGPADELVGSPSSECANEPAYAQLAARFRRLAPLRISAAAH